jgi:hypothetical protein
MDPRELGFYFTPYSNHTDVIEKIFKQFHRWFSPPRNNAHCV